MDSGVAKKNFDYCEETIALKYRLELSYLEFAERLYKISRDRLYLPNYDSFPEFLEELKISGGSASKLINVWVKFVMEFKVSKKVLSESGGWTKAAEILPYADSRQSAEDWLMRAKTLGRSDLRKMIKEAKTGILMGECPHPKNQVETITFCKCGRCGDTWRI